MSRTALSTSKRRANSCGPAIALTAIAGLEIGSEFRASWAFLGRGCIAAIQAIRKSLVFLGRKRRGATQTKHASDNGEQDTPANWPRQLLPPFTHQALEWKLVSSMAESALPKKTIQAAPGEIT